MRFLQRQVEESVIKVPKQDISESLTFVGQEVIPQRQGSPISGNPQQEDSTDGQAILEKTLFTPGPSYHLLAIK